MSFLKVIENNLRRVNLMGLAKYQYTIRSFNTMALLSPGTQITVIDDSVYVPGEPGTIPYILVATSANKTAASGSSLAQGTLPANATKLYKIGSQRELTETFGIPTFQVDGFNTIVQGSEVSEYGLFAAYSYLGLSNSAYIQRADIDLSQLAGSASAPVGIPVNGTYWFDLSTSLFGIFEWDAANQVFKNKVPLLITDSSYIDTGTPIGSFGTIGSYAINTTSTDNKVFYKASDNAWYQVGSNGWREKWATVRSTATVSTITSAVDLVINGTTITTTGTSLSSGLVSVINLNSTLSTAGISAAVVNNKLEIYSDNVDVVIGGGSNGGLLTQLHITAKTYRKPILTYATHTQIPQYFSTDSSPRPDGSLWIKTTSPNLGGKFVVKKYDSVAGSWVTMQAPIYTNNSAAITAYAGSGDASDIVTGVIYVDYDVSDDSTGSFKIKYWEGNIPNSVTGTNISPTVTSGHTFTLNGSTVSIGGNTAADFVTAVSAANVSHVTAVVLTSGAIEIKNSIGDEIVLVEGTGNPLAAVGIDAGTYSNWSLLSYEASAATPTSNPDANTLWYDTNINSIDIMQHNGTTWVGYKNISANATTDPAGVIIAASKPSTQSDNTSLVSNDLWLDTSDLDNYPKLYRYDGLNWNLIDDTDQTSMQGILFHDARVNSTGETTGSVLPVDLLVSDYLDPDAPDPVLYPRGMLLFNTRISGMVVRQYKPDLLNPNDYPDGNTRISDDLPTWQDRWVLHSGTKANGSLYGARKAQRASVVQALAAAVNASYEIRDPSKFFNLIAAPGYPELMPDLVNLNIDRKETAFIIGETPMRLNNSTTSILNWANNSNNAAETGEDGLTISYTYSSIYYPNGYATSLSGANVAVPASHAMLRTFAYNDAVGEQWFAPAGLRRGVLSNLVNVGYVNSTDGEFKPVGLTAGQEDSLYTSKINPLLFIPGSGLVAMGQKTLSAIQTSEDRVNVARLVVYLRRQLDIISRPFIFEPNDKITRSEIKGVIDRMMNDLTTRRGLYDFLVVCDESNNTPTRIDRNELWVDIAIEPVRAVEFIYIPIRLKATGTIHGAQAI